MKKIYFLGIFCMISSWLSAQAQYQSITPYTIFNIGYTYQNASFLNAGVDEYLVMRNNHIIDLGASVDMGILSRKFTAIPKIGVGYLFNAKNSVVDPYSSNFNSAFYVLRANVTPWSIEPEAGITILSLLELTAGYGFEFREHKEASLNGLKIGVNVKLPLLLFCHD
ncbi:hypothetical protein EDL99_04625 [Ornithobacterium rhinotracheale]|uniref:hypothetical protein n=1 Tax=Ornithobacterium rhinotracheale TaxID=28251 RepID=UPI00129C6EEB|nr:hypothetical protein [Ornithobacterium rhinotracheale]MRJ08170.1 hypothetical protein [Ornithobacterium rhinotracheale]UOH77368.1 hypothetical protein MT996_09130 [Ornithobacterium rhinotracheale]